MTTTASLHRSRSGFTFIELVIVVMLLGVFAGVAAPRYREAIQHAELQRAAVTIVADLRRARGEAIRNSAPRSLSFDLAHDTYDSGDLSDPDHPDRQLSRDLAARDYPIDIATAALSGAVNASEVTIEFNWAGDTTNDGTLTLQAGAQQATITVNRSGAVEVVP